jgi:phosphoribosylformylglycinamidine cyclo-ligase
MKDKKLSYQKSGVNYHIMDPIKKLAQDQARKTAHNLTSFSFAEMSASRGESAYVWDEGDSYKAFVIEGLGTKNRVADIMQTITGKSYYATIAQDTVAMIVNDLIVVGAAPLIINAYFAVGNSEWFADVKRSRDLITGWGHACDLAGATWGGGETPTLREIVAKGSIDLAGSAIGIINPKSRLTLGDKLQTGDRILLIESSGIHANGLTLARAVAEKLPKKYQTKLPNGKSYGETLLTPTHMYAKLVRDLFEQAIDIHYMVNITGHGWRKLMRATQPFSYIIESLPQPQEEFGVIQKISGNSDKDMYGNFNMGAGFALFLTKKDVTKAEKIIKKHKLQSIDAGYIEKGPKQVIIKQKNITFSAEQLDLR